ncbi:1-acyl-sn-glycerol-3-phosphate acyltransferase [Actinopolyspora alba]|uniref:1-acyl-sn-glycerol-3-phosphate acyltransferase n=1 Tax=Actinopolyspora alba TaxID=673379 RepID=A0A1I1XF20_9ACTN|nr:lysophospholipid acyltransferase family protein [Actinopolyspora alba]SFE05238.1 1-acyl-sn-glycerol-3-phosphate acyltransferase [Actinopolyspora alba]
MLYWVMKYVLLGPLMRLWCRPKIEGAHHVPESGGAILVSNHLAVADSFLMPLMLPRRVTFLAKREYFTGKGLTGALKRIFFSGVGQVPLDRSSGAAAQAALDTGIRLLREGQLLGLYPEGTRSPDGRLYKGKTGVARMALEADVPVIPVVTIGTEKVNPIGSKMWRPYSVRVRVGQPLDFSRYEGLAGDRFAERSITDEIMYSLMELSGQEYVDIYADRAKDDIAESGRVISKRERQAAKEAGKSDKRMPDSKAG